MEIATYRLIAQRLYQLRLRVPRLSVYGGIMCWYEA
jgi:hypothetical protein